MTGQATVERPVVAVERDLGVAALREMLVAQLVDSEVPALPRSGNTDGLASPEHGGDVQRLEQEIGHILFTNYLQAVVASTLPPSSAQPNPLTTSDATSNECQETRVRAKYVPERVEVMNAVLDPSYFPPPRVAATPDAGIAVEVPRRRRAASAVARSRSVGIPDVRRAGTHFEELWHRFTTTALVRVERRRLARPERVVPVVQDRRRRRLATGFAWVQNVGALLILFAGWQIWGTTITEHHAQSSLRVQFESEAHKHAPPVTHHAPSTSSPPVSLFPASAQLANPPEGSVVGHIEIPAIDVSQYVVSGTAEGDLAKGPGHYVGTALPGQAGNVDIAGHRTTYGAPFYRLGQLVTGDPIELTTLSGETLTYVVSGAPTTVLPGDTAILGYFGDNRLTLTTCTPPFSASHRLVVVASLQLPGPMSAPEKLAHVIPKPYKHIASSATASWGWGSLPPALAAFGILVGLGLMHRRMKKSLGRLGQWIVLAPIWVAGLYLLFESLSGLLPASV